MLSTRSERLVHVKFFFPLVLSCARKIHHSDHSKKKKKKKDMGGSVTTYSDTPIILCEAGNYIFIMQNPLTLMHHAAR